MMNVNQILDTALFGFISPLNDKSLGKKFDVFLSTLFLEDKASHKVLQGMTYELSYIFQVVPLPPLPVHL